MESNVLMRRAAWCGVVFALAMILTFLNFMPPMSVKYHVRSKLVVSESRLEKLRGLVLADRSAVKQDANKDILLLSVKVLDLAEQEHSADSEPTNEKVVLIEVGTLWSSRCTAERHYQWLNNISKIAPDKLAQASAAQAVRFARWELEAAEHYQSQFAFLAAKEVLPPEPLASDTGEPSSSSTAEAARPRTFQLASYAEPTSAGSSATGSSATGSSATGSSAELTSHTFSNSMLPGAILPDSAPATAAATEQPDSAITTTQAQLAAGAESQAAAARSFKLQLQAQVEQAKRRVEQTEVAWMQEIDRSSGTLQIASVPLIAPRPTSIPFWMAASILVLGLATGSTASWCQLRGHSRGTFHVGQVAEQLALHSVPTAARLVLPRLEFQSAVAMAGPVTVARIGHGLTRLGEWGLTFWVILATSRFFLDTIWRDVLVNSPLAAFGRLLTGMP